MNLTKATVAELYFYKTRVETCFTLDYGQMNFPKVRACYPSFMKLWFLLLASSLSYGFCHQLEPFVIHCDFADSSLDIYLTYIDKAATITMPAYIDTVPKVESTANNNIPTQPLSHDALRWLHILDNYNNDSIMPTMVSIFRSSEEILELGTHRLSHPTLRWQHYLDDGVFYAYVTCLSSRYVALPILNHENTRTVVVDVISQESFTLPSYIWQVKQVASLAEGVLALEVSNFMGYAGIQVIDMPKQALLIDETLRFVASNRWLRARDNTLLIRQQQHFPEEGKKISSLLLYHLDETRELSISHSCSVEDDALYPNWQERLETMPLPNADIISNLYQQPSDAEAACLELFEHFAR